MADQTTTIPKGWKASTLEEVVLKANTGADAIKRAPIVNKDTGIKCLRIQDVSQKKDYKNWGFTSVSDSDFKKFQLKNGELFIARTGASIGANLIINKDLNAVFNNGLIRLRVNEKSIPSYVSYLLFSQHFKNYILSISQGTSTQPNIQIGALLRFPIVIPPIPEQNAIVSILSSLDKKIELLKEQNSALETTAQAIFKEWFVNFNFPGATGKMIDSELGEIPEGWRVGKLIEDGISEFIKTNIDQFDGVKDYIETANVNLSNFVGNFEKITYIERASRANMQPIPNSFWFARMAESRKYLLFQERDRQNIETKILSTGFAGIKCIKEYLYFYWCFILSDIFNNLKNQYAEGAVQVAISNGGIQRIMLVLPPKDLAKKFTETIGFCFEKISNNNAQIQTLSALRDALMPKLMKGEVRAKEFDK